MTANDNDNSESETIPLDLTGEPTNDPPREIETVETTLTGERVDDSSASTLTDHGAADGQASFCKFSESDEDSDTDSDDEADDE